MIDNCMTKISYNIFVLNIKMKVPVILISIEMNDSHVRVM